MMNVPSELATSVLHKAIGRYQKELADYRSKGSTELNLRPAFQNLLAEMARRVNLTLVHEMTIRGRIRPDGVLVNEWRMRRGYWEAKGPEGKLEEEIAAKRRSGYPLDNALFENTVQGVLFQGGQRFDFNMSVIGDVTVMLQRFLTYQKPETANFEQAVLDFKDQIPNIATRLLELINIEQASNAKFIAAFNTFFDRCRTTLNPKISTDEIKEMLVQHLLTERLFRTVFNNPDFVRNNVIAAEIEGVIAALTSRTFNRSEFLRSLDPFYGAIEAAARGIETWAERQSFLNTVYERFFQGFAVRKADTLGIVYTPQEIVEFMVASVDEVLQREFGKSLATPGVKILDPCVGTGNFIVNIIKHIPRTTLRAKYLHDLFCNEITLLPYYIASLNIEHEYYEKMHNYEPFDGICFVDTLELAESQQLPLWMVEENTERINREKEADIMVVIGNPPYNVGQKNENDNNKNRRYKVIDDRIRETYVKASTATNRNALSDAYVRFFRWATDRLQGRDGIVCFVSNNSFLEGLAFDGFRKLLGEDFTHIYHVSLGGNARKRESGNVFGIMVGVGITVLVRHRNDLAETNQKHSIFYHEIDPKQTGAEKLADLAKASSLSGIEWQELMPNEQNIWIVEGLMPDFEHLPALGSKEAKFMPVDSIQTIFRTFTNGVKTNRDHWVYDFDKRSLETRIIKFIETYNTEIDRWVRAGEPDEIDAFVLYDDTKIKWSRDLKSDLKRKRYAEFHPNKIRQALYRPFTRKYYCLDAILSQDIFLQPKFFPTPTNEQENIVICVPGLGDRKGFGCLATNFIANLDLAFEKVQCFPYYTYAEDGSNRRENITDWALGQFRARYGEGVSKWDIFHYVYAMLHHPGYRERYAENLKRDLPHIPLLKNSDPVNVAPPLARGAVPHDGTAPFTGDLFTEVVEIGRALMDLHVNYEQQEPYALTALEDETVPYGQLFQVQKMKLTPDRAGVVVSRGLTLAGIPEQCFSYRLGNRSALEWVIDQYQVTRDARSGITSDPNRADEPEYIAHLVCKVVTVSVKTVELVERLSAAVSVGDWMEGGYDMDGEKR